jgi:hypothetical protein
MTSSTKLGSIIHVIFSQHSSMSHHAGINTSYLGILPAINPFAQSKRSPLPAYSSNRANRPNRVPCAITNFNLACELAHIQTQKYSRPPLDRPFCIHKYIHTYIHEIHTFTNWSRLSTCFEAYRSCESRPIRYFDLSVGFLLWTTSHFWRVAKDHSLCFESQLWISFETKRLSRHRNPSPLHEHFQGYNKPESDEDFRQHELLR